jgi:ELWxxDGT repeat protein
LHGFTTIVAVPNPDPGSFPTDPGRFEPPSQPVPFNGGAIFTGTDPATGAELWRSDGTAAGTAIVKDIDSGTQSTIFAGLASDGNKIIFQVGTIPNPRQPLFVDYSLWVSNGAQAGTFELMGLPGQVDLTNVASSGGVLYFLSNDTGGNGMAIWKTDGTVAGTQEVLSGFDLVDSPQHLTASGGFVYFSEDTPGEGAQLWRSDGTAAGTVQLTDLNAPSGFQPYDMTDVSGTLFFGATDGVNGYQLWKSDGTTAGTTMVTVINPVNSFIHDTVAVGNTLYFGVDDGTNGDQLWKSDGTAAGTTMVTDVNVAGGGINPNDVVNVGGNLFFTADDGVNGRQLWESDGTPGGTFMVTVINPGGDADVHEIAAAGNRAFFVANDGTDGDQIWSSDGTAAGTVMLTTAPTTYLDTGLVGVGGTAFFAAFTQHQGMALWASDGTVAGTQAVKVFSKDFNFGDGSFIPELAPADLTAAGGVLYLDANDLTHGDELWKAVPPVASLSGPSSGTVNQSLTFTLRASEPTVHNPSAIYAFVVNWGDGTFDVLAGTSGLTDAHAYAAAGDYAVTVTAVDKDGLTSLPASASVVISDPPLQASALANDSLSATAVRGRAGDGVVDVAMASFAPSDWVLTLLRGSGRNSQ